MNEGPTYVSSIPANAREEDAPPDHAARPGKVVKNCYIGRSYVGQRVYNEEGLLVSEEAYKDGERHGWTYTWNEDGGLARARCFGNGKLHGMEYGWHADGRLAWATAYENGREHGTARQWGPSGALIGSYTMDHGTGIDLWWGEDKGKVQLIEARVIVDSLWDGYEYKFIDGSPGMLMSERWWRRGELHGIERYWDHEGRLLPEYPVYWIHDGQVDKDAYERAARLDANMQPLRIEDNAPHRVFPPEVAAHLP